MKFSKVAISDLMIKQFADSLPEKVEKIDVTKSKSQLIYRIEMKDIDVPAYLLIDNKDSTTKGIHWCEKNENGSNCNHLAVLAGVAHKLDGSLDRISLKTKLSDIENISQELSEAEWNAKNSSFGLPVKVEEPEVEETQSEEVVATPSVSSTTPVSRDWRIGWNEVNDYLDSQGVPVNIIAKVQERRQQISSTVSMQQMMIPPQKPTLPYNGEMVSRALRHILNGKDLILVGGKGTGKDTLINTLSWILNLPVSIHVGNKDETKESIVGEPAFRDGESTFDLSLFAKTVQHGGIANMAEVNMLLGDVTSVYHSLLDDNGVLATPIGSIPRNQHFIMIGSMNVGEGYAGVRELNDAFKDRFAILRMPQTTNFETMIKNKTGLYDKHGLMFLDRIKRAVDLLLIEESQGHAANTIRGYIDAANYFVEFGINHDTKVEVIEDYILNKIEDIDEYMAARDMIRQEGWSDFPISKEEEDYMKGEV